jgi:uncharacterized membrane protein
MGRWQLPSSICDFVVVRPVGKLEILARVLFLVLYVIGSRSGYGQMYVLTGRRILYSLAILNKNEYTARLRVFGRALGP